MGPRPYSDKSSHPDTSNDEISDISSQVHPEPPLSAPSTPSPTLQEEIPVEPIPDPPPIQESSRTFDVLADTACYPTPGDVMPYDHSLPDFIRQITNQPNLSNLQSLSLRVISTLVSLHRMAAYLPNLKELNLEGSVLNSLRDIGCNFKNLHILKVGRCQLESLDGTFGLTSLRELYAQKNHINDVSPCSNLPHVRHIDVSSNRIRNISYAGFLSVCSKLKSIVFAGNPATESADYRNQIKKILPQVETLDGIPLVEEEESKEKEFVENTCEGSDTSSTGVPDFSSLSPSDSMNNFLDSEEDAIGLDKRSKQTSCQDERDSGNSDARTCVQSEDDLKNLNVLQSQVKTVKLGNSKFEGKIADNKNSRQKCASIQKLDKDIKNRSKKSNIPLNADFSSEFLEESLSSVSIPSTSSFTRVTGGEHDLNLDDCKNEITKTSSLSQDWEKNSSEKEHMWAPTTLTTGTPVCGNLTAALRNRKKNQNSQDSQLSQAAVESNGASGDYLDVDLVDEENFIDKDVLDTSKKWRETFRRFRSNNRARWEEEEEQEDCTDFKEESHGNNV